MSSSDVRAIRDKAKAIRTAHSEFLSNAMKDYNERVYRPALIDLQEECLATFGSHTNATRHDNGLGWVWWFCGRCGARHSSEYIGPAVDTDAEN